METADSLLIGFFLFSCIAGLTWFFSTRRRLFLRVFVPREELFGAARSILRDPHFGRGMRLIAALQFAVAVVFGLVSLWLRRT